jgi:hypothetical protein
MIRVTRLSRGYSGAQTPSSSLKGLRVFAADRLTPPQEVEPPPSSRKYWTRRGIAEWLVERLSQGPPTLVGIDHGFSFPLQYFEDHGLTVDWTFFLDDFQRHWPTDEDIYVEFVRDGSTILGGGNSLNESENSFTNRRHPAHPRRCSIRCTRRVACHIHPAGPAQPATTCPC